jgi:hypothetical protein
MPLHIPSSAGFCGYIEHNMDAKRTDVTDFDRVFRASVSGYPHHRIPKLLRNQGLGRRAWFLFFV